MNENLPLSSTHALFPHSKEEEQRSLLKRQALYMEISVQEFSKLYFRVLLTRYAGGIYYFLFLW